MPATVVSSEQVNDPSVRGLKKCFDPQCDNKLDSNSCNRVMGCYWCVRDYYDAPLDKKYCADIDSCYGGKEGKTNFFGKEERVWCLRFFVLHCPFPWWVLGANHTIFEGMVG